MLSRYALQCTVSAFEEMALILDDLPYRESEGKELTQVSLRIINLSQHSESPEF